MSKVARIHVHIGLEKTGTTYLQNALGENSMKLSKAGWYYPKMLGSWNHHALPVLVLGSENLQDIHHIYGGENIDFEQLKQQIRYCLEERPRNNQQIILCSEHLSSRLRDESQLQELRDFLNEIGEDVTISLFIRRQDKMMEATYSTAIKTGAKAPVVNSININFKSIFINITPSALSAKIFAIPSSLTFPPIPS